MFSTKSKIILAVVVLFFVALIVVLIFNATRKTDQTTEPQEFIQTPESSSAAGLPTYPSDQTETRTAIAGFAMSQTPPIPPVPSRTDTSGGLFTPIASNTKTASTDSQIAGKTIGYFDWTRNQTKNEQQLTINKDTREKLATKDVCALSGIQDIWSNPFEKTLCGMTKFVSNQILEPLNAMSCNLLGSALALNYDSTIRSKFIDSTCIIEDRK